MNLTYIFLILSVLSCFFSRKKIITKSLIVITLSLGVVQNILGLYELIYLGVFYFITFIFLNKNNINKALKIILLITISIFTILFNFHIFSGFHNILALKNVVLSPLSIPLSMYLNMDKTIAALILFINSDLYEEEKQVDVKSCKIALIILLSSIFCLMTLSILLGYVEYDFKIPKILPIWCINNLLFVCFAEEVIYRGIIQKSLRKFFFTSQNRSYLSVLLASIIFSAIHIHGGLSYTLLSLLAGIFYGITYEKTQKIIYPIVVHFGVNLTHLIFFTYPASINIIS